MPKLTPMTLHLFLCIAVMLSAKAKGASEPYLVSPETGFEFTVSEGLKGSMGLGTVVKTMKREQKVHLMLQPECESQEFQSLEDVHEQV